MTETTHLVLPLLAAAQAQKHVTVNEALGRLDALVQLAVVSRTVTAPPGSPAAGVRYIVPAGATGAWSGWDDSVAVFLDGAWQRLEPRAGWIVWSAAEAELRVWDGTAWVPAAEGNLANLTMLGINAAADSTNRLVVSGLASLFNHAGAGHQVKINKAALGDTASLLFQSDFSGRAELGLAGEDDFSFKVSPDGSSWVTALQLIAASGLAQFPAGAEVGGVLSATAMQEVTAGYGGTANAIALTTGAGVSGTPPTGLRLRFRASAANTGATTIAVDGGSPVVAQTMRGTALPAGYIRTDVDTVARFEGTHWRLDRAPQLGSGPNGYFQRLASGHLMCWHSFKLIFGNATRLLADWTFPAAFGGTGFPALTANLQNEFLDGTAPPSNQQLLGPWARQGNSPNLLSCSVRLYCVGSASFGADNEASVYTMAVGRWY